MGKSKVARLGEPVPERKEKKLHAKETGFEVVNWMYLAQDRDKWQLLYRR
jgi:hypothetical protein